MSQPVRVPRPYVDALSRAPRNVAAGQHCASPSGDEVVVFLIGMRINRLRRVRTWWPVAASMVAMLRELSTRPESGLLGARNYWSGRILMSVQYWRSIEQLGAYARDPSLAHSPMWARFNRAFAGTGDVGIFHETYVVPADRVESLYGNMAPVGLAAAHGWVPRPVRVRNTAVDRMGQRDPGFVEAG